MAFYESVFIARQDISATQVDGLTDTFSQVIEQNGGKIAKKENWGLRTLAYKIKKNRKGHYVQLSIDAPAEAIAEMERQMRINEDLLRYLTMRVDELDAEPSVMMRSKGEREDRPRGDRGDRGDRGGFGGPKKPEFDAPKTETPETKTEGSAS